MKKIFLFGVAITNESESEILKYILYSLKKTQEKYYIVTPNPEILVYASKHEEFKKILNNARLGLPDGIGLIWAAKILRIPLKEKVTGVDLLEKLCKEVSKKPITVGFLGGGPKIAERTADCLVKKYPGLRVAFVDEEWPSRCSAIDILFVALGFPKQEEWMSKNLQKIPVRIAMGVGGAFDYVSGAVPRAPLLIRLIGFEWLFRLIVQPWRIKRQLALLEFIFLVLKKRFV